MTISEVFWKVFAGTFAVVLGAVLFALLWALEGGVSRWEPAAVRQALLILLIAGYAVTRYFQSYLRHVVSPKAKICRYSLMLVPGLLALGFVLVTYSRLLTIVLLVVGCWLSHELLGGWVLRDEMRREILDRSSTADGQSPARCWWCVPTVGGALAAAVLGFKVIEGEIQAARLAIFGPPLIVIYFGAMLSQYQRGRGRLRWTSLVLYLSVVLAMAALRLSSHFSGSPPE